MKKYVGLLIFTWHLLVHAAPGLPVDALRELRSTHREFDLKSFTMGKLRPGEADTVVAVIREVEEDEDDARKDWPLLDRALSYRIVILAEQENAKGKYGLQRETPQLGELRGKYEFSVDIRNGSLFLHTTSGHGGGMSDYFQFKYSNGALRLIGLEAQTWSSMEGKEDVSCKTSVNFLTGLRKDMRSRVSNGKEKVRQTQSRFSLPPVLFENFSFFDELPTPADCR